MKKRIPKFRNEDQERAFWAKADATDHVDFARAPRTFFPNLKPTSQTISLRLPESLLNAIKTLAHRQDVPYQSLMKMLLSESVSRRTR